MAESSENESSKRETRQDAVNPRTVGPNPCFRTQRRMISSCLTVTKSLEEFSFVCVFVFAISNVLLHNGKNTSTYKMEIENLSLHGVTGSYFLLLDSFYLKISHWAATAAVVSQ